MIRTTLLMWMMSLALSACSGSDACKDIACTGHGMCAEDDGDSVCLCDEGYAGDLCQECAAGFHQEGEECAPSAVCRSDTCHGNGTCDDATGEIVCDCDSAYAGDQCEGCGAGHQDHDADGTCLPDCVTSGLTCGSFGICDDSDGSPACVCDLGYLGPACDDCDTGFQDNDQDGSCTPTCVIAELDCGDHGACDASTGTASCACDEGYEGVTCESCDAGYQDFDADGACLPDCATAGLGCGDTEICDDSSGTTICVCAQGYQGAACDECDLGYQDYDGDGACSPDCEAAGLGCGPNELCDDASGTASCVCIEGYTGFGCTTCDAGYQDNDRDGSCLVDCANHSCSVNGTCDDASGTPICTCDVDWYGPNCSVLFVTIQGGTFSMGSDSGLGYEMPVHLVNVPTFAIMKTEVTVDQYRQCVQDHGFCLEPGTGVASNWDTFGRDDHPINYVDWYQAEEFCRWLGGRLPSEAEWEYAARGGGQAITYPWGERSPSCALAVYADCPHEHTEPVCSRPNGNTDDGLCDMAGNEWEWLQDWFHLNYVGAPADGSAWITPFEYVRVARGASWVYAPSGSLRVSYRRGEAPSSRLEGLGIRCAMTLE